MQAVKSKPKSDVKFLGEENAFLPKDLTTELPSRISLHNDTKFPLKVEKGLKIENLLENILIIMRAVVRKWA